MLQEYIPLGQRVESYHLDYQSADGCWHPLAEATTIGYKRILLTPTVTARAVRLTIDRSLACPIINRLALFRDTVYTPPVSD
jgi:alpha-L-fucosidase